jgi:hypothetical protein
MTVLRDWCTSPSATANPPFQSPQAQLESGVRGNVPAPFGAGERLQSPTYRYRVIFRHLSQAAWMVHISRSSALHRGGQDFLQPCGPNRKHTGSVAIFL